MKFPVLWSGLGCVSPSVSLAIWEYKFQVPNLHAVQHEDISARKLVQKKIIVAVKPGSRFLGG